MRSVRKVSFAFAIASAGARRFQPAYWMTHAVMRPPTSSMAPRTWTKSGKFQSSGRMAASTAVTLPASRS